MNTNDGALEFEAVMKNDKFLGAVQENERRVKGFSQATVVSGQAIDDAFAKTTQKILLTKENIAVIEADIKKLNSEIGKMSPGQAQANLMSEARAAAKALDEEKAALIGFTQEIKNSEKANVSFRTQLRNVREELIRMENAGQRGTDAYQALQKKAGELKDAVGDAQAQMAAMANDERGFQGVVSALSGVTGAFSAAQGTVGLFAGESENLNRIMLKVQSLMAITIGLQQVAQTLNKDSYFSVVLLAKGKLMLATMTDRLSVSLGISTVAAQALMATLTLGLSVAITAAAVLISKYIDKQKEAKEASEAFNKTVVDNAYKQLAALEQLSAEWAGLGDNLKEKQKFVTDNAKSFEDLGVKINDVKDAENLLINNKEKFIEALMLRAKAMAAAELAAEKYKEALLKSQELSKTPEKIKKTEYVTDPETGRLMASYNTETDNEKYRKVKEEKDKLEKEAAALITQQIEFSAAEKKILQGIGQSADKTIEGSITAIEQSLSKLKDKYKEATTDIERENLTKQIKEQEKLLEKMDLLGGKKGEKKAVDGLVQAREELEKAIKTGDQTAIDSSAKKLEALQREKTLLDAIAESALTVARNMVLQPKGPATVADAIEEMKKASGLDFSKVGKLPKTVPLETGKLNKSVAESKNKLDKEAQEKLEKEAKLRQEIVGYALQLVDALRQGMDLTEGQAAALDGAMNTVSALGKGDYIGAAISGLTTAVGAILDTSGIEEKLSKPWEDFENWISRSNDALQRYIKLRDEAIGGERYVSSDKAIKEAQDIKAEAESKLNDMKLSWTFSDWSVLGWKAWDNVTAAIERTNNALGGFVEIEKETEFMGTVKSVVSYGVSKLTKDAEGNFSLDKLRELIKNGTVADEAVIKAVADYDANMDELITLQKEKQELLTNTLGSSIADSIVEGFKNGYDSAADFAADFENLMKDAILNAVKIKYLEKPMQDWYAKFALDMESEGGLDEKEKKALQEWWDSIIALGKKETDSAFSAAGIDLSNNTAKSSAITGISASLTEETGSLIAGIGTAIRIDIKDMSVGIKSLESLGLQQISILDASLFQLIRIGKNTDPLSGQLSEIRDLTKETNRILTNQL